jgi:hypothetical protein
MNQHRTNLPTKPEPLDKKDLQVPGHGDPLEDAVERVTAATKPPRRPEDLRGDEIME